MNKIKFWWKHLNNFISIDVSVSLCHFYFEFLIFDHGIEFRIDFPWFILLMMFDRLFEKEKIICEKSVKVDKTHSLRYSLLFYGNMLTGFDFSICPKHSVFGDSKVNFSLFGLNQEIAYKKSNSMENNI